MKTLLYIILLLCVSFTVASQNSADDPLKICKEMYQKKNYSEALTCFQQYPENVHALYYSAIISDSLGDKKAFKKYSENLISKKIRTAQSYRLYSDLFAKDSTRYIKIVSKGLKYFPHDTTLITCKINFYLNRQDYKTVIPLLDELLAYKKSNLKMLYFARGYASEMTRDTVNAFRYYDLAIAADSAYFDPWYNKAALYYNRAVDMYDVANKENDNNKYHEKLKKAEAALLESLPHLLKADKMKPDDPIVLESLKSVYYRLHMLKEFEAIKKRIEANKKN